MMRKAVVMVWLLPHAALLVGCTDHSPNSGDATSHTITAFVGVSVVPMTSVDALVDHQTVLVQGDRIVEIGPKDEVPVPARALRIDGAGRYLMPALADMHVHLEYFEEPEVLKLFLANGVTTVRNMDGRAYILTWRDAVARGDMLGPTIYTAGPLLDGNPPILEDNTVVQNAAEARSHVLEQASASYDFVKVYSNLSPEAYDAVLSTAEEWDLPVAGHVPSGVDLDAVLSGGQVSLEHLADLGEWVEADDSPVRNEWHWSKLYVGMPVDSAKVATVVERIAASGMRVVPTMVQADRALAPQDTVREWLMAPEMAHVPDEVRAFWQERIRSSTARMDAEDWSLVSQGRDNRVSLVRALHAAGALLLIGTDTPNPFVVPGFSVAEELENFVKAGFTPGEALGAATRDAASFLGELEEWGTIELDKRADLLLLQANPLDDVRHVRDLDGVMVRGRWMPEAELRDMLSGLSLR